MRRIAPRADAPEVAARNAKRCAVTIEAILFDNDGVLVDTEGVYFAATAEILARAGTHITREEYIECSLRRGQSLFDRLLAVGWTRAAVADLRAERNALYAKRLESANLLIDGAAAVVGALAHHYRIAIVTSSLREHLEIAHRQSGILALCETVVAREDYEKSKPNPEPYLTALKRIALASARCVVVEDSERGLAAARGAGLRCIIVPNELTRGQNFSGASVCLSDISALPRAIDSL